MKGENTLNQEIYKLISMLINKNLILNEKKIFSRILIHPQLLPLDLDLDMPACLNWSIVVNLSACNKRFYDITNAGVYFKSFKQNLPT
jgi:hypothetical protein